MLLNTNMKSFNYTDCDMKNIFCMKYHLHKFMTKMLFLGMCIFIK